MRISLRLALPAGALVAAAALVMAGLNGFGATTRLAAASGAQAAYPHRSAQRLQPDVGHRGLGPDGGHRGRLR